MPIYYIVCSKYFYGVDYISDFQRKTLVKTITLHFAPEAINIL